jgi:replicative DNA helicase
MDVERALLSCLINEADTNVAVNSRVLPEFFLDTKWKRVYEFLLDHFRRYGQSADKGIIDANFPSYEWPTFTQPVEYFINELRSRRKKTLFLDGLNKAAGHVQFSDPDDLAKIEEIFMSTVMQVRTETAPALDMSLPTVEGSALVNLDERILDPGFLRGISSGFKGIDYVTRGFQPEQFVVLIGLPKSLKSSMLLYMAIKAQDAAKSALFIGFEMNNDEQGDRMSSLFGEVGLTKVLNGTVTDNEHKRIIDGWKRRRYMRDIIFSTDMGNALTVSGVQGKVMSYMPDVVFIDAAYLMQSELPKVEQQSAAALTDIARELKKLAQAMHIPVVVTTQASETRSKGGKLNSNSAMYTQAWRQSADVLLGVERADPEADDHGEVIVRLKVLSSRSGPRAETTIVWNWSRGQVIEIDPTVVAGVVNGS